MEPANVYNLGMDNYKMVRLRADVYARIEELKGGKSFTAFISELLDKPTQATPQSTTTLPQLFPPKNKFVPTAPIGSIEDEEEDEEIETGKYDLKLNCCKKLLESGGRLTCKHWQWRGNDLLNTITRKRSIEYDEDGTWNPEI